MGCEIINGIRTKSQHELLIIFEKLSQYTLITEYEFSSLTRLRIVFRSYDQNLTYFSGPYLLGPPVMPKDFLINIHQHLILEK